ncbi:MAG TPA: hypothetical protein VG755_42040, partial [Nannocystaceae bacterium]|nr:hypothetical protein [Nannocystaceae bacterium]
MRSSAIAMIVLAACRAATATVVTPPLEPRAAAPICAAADAVGIAACVDRERMLADVRTIAGARPPGSVHHAEVATRCDAVLDELGFEIARSEQRSLDRRLALFVERVIERLVLRRNERPDGLPDGFLSIGAAVDADVDGGDAHRLAGLHMQRRDVGVAILGEIAVDFGVVVAVGLERRPDLSGRRLVEPVRLRGGDVARRVLVDLDRAHRRAEQRLV